MAARSKSDSTELKVLGSVKVPANRRIEMAPEEKEEGSNVIGLMDALKQSLGRKKSAATAKGKMHTAARRSRKRRAV
jgi:DNA end-binding protein Ku